MNKKQLKHAIYYDNRFGRNDGPPLYYWNCLRQNPDWKVFHLIPTGDTLKDIGPVDYHWWIDWGEDALNYPDWKIPDDGGKKIYVASDTHLDNGYRLKKAHEFDYVFFNQKSAFTNYVGRPDLPENMAIIYMYHKLQKIAWLPHAFEPKAYPNITTLKKYDIGFVGHMQQDLPNYNNMSRVQALDRLFREFPNFYYGTRHPQFPSKNLFEDAARRFSESKIVFNISIRDDINMRVFETLGAGSFLLTNYLPTLGELFEDGKHLVTYNSYNDMIEKAKYYLEHDEEREKIAEAGYQEVINKHTYQHRIDKIMRIINE
jgi:glycosyltransferase involved in cell wall biosynthesis